MPETNWESNIRFATLVENEPSKFGDVDYVSNYRNKIQSPMDSISLGRVVGYII